jgi:SSS family solute:Na+ symporter
MSGFVSVILNPIRYFMITGFVVLGLIFYEKLNLVVGDRIDFEQILPSAINEFVPVGLLGLMLAGLLAAFNGTFAGTLNAAQAYIVNDIYLKYIKPAATNVQIKTANYIFGVLVVGVSIVIGIFAQDVNSILQWIVSALWGSYISSNILKWYWWRFNGQGYFWGMVAGIIPALVFPLIFKQTLELYYFPLIMVISLAGCLIGTFSAPPTEEKVLKEFYKTVRPWGFWKPILEKVRAEDPSFESNKNFKRDMFNIVIGIVWQTAIIILPIYFILKKEWYVGVTVAIILMTSTVLKKTWWDRLNDEPST